LQKLTAKRARTKDLSTGVEMGGDGLRWVMADGVW